MARLVNRLPESRQASALREMREKFRQDATDDELDDRLRVAGEKIAFLRIMTPKGRSNQQSHQRFVYKDGKVVEGSGETLQGGRVVSNWDGKNLDPCSVKRHNQQLRRAGFANNLHAKGIF